MSAEAGDLEGTVAVVTGSSRGIGKGIAITLGQRGCTVYVTGRSAGGTTTEQVSKCSVLEGLEYSDCGRVWCGVPTGTGLDGTLEPLYLHSMSYKVLKVCPFACANTTLFFCLVWFGEYKQSKSYRYMAHICTSLLRSTRA